jgi:SAM-dependent methyltransferase
MATYVQYGCGLSCPDGWINFDASPTLRLQRLALVGPLFRRGGTIFPDNVRYGDILAGLPIADGSADGVYASHVVEHLSYEDFWTALGNTFRLLKPGGLFRLVVPDLEVRARSYIDKLRQGDPDGNSWFMRSSLLGAESRSRGPVALLRSAFGHNAHLWMWDEASMAAALRKAGFIEVRRCSFNDSADAAFRLVEEESRFRDPATGLEECAMEARKPA